MLYKYLNFIRWGTIINNDHEVKIKAIEAYSLKMKLYTSHAYDTFLCKGFIPNISKDR